MSRPSAERKRERLQTDTVDETWKRVVREASPEPVRFHNSFTPLARMLGSFSPGEWSDVEYDVLGEVTSTLKDIAQACLREEFAVVQVPRNMRLNSTLPECPELASVMGMEEEAGVSADATVSFDAGQSASEEWAANATSSRTSEKAKTTKEQRRRYVIDRVKRRLLTLKNGHLGIIQWLLLSPATPAWKKTIMREICPDGFLRVFDIDMTLEFIFALIIVAASRWRVVKCVMEQNLEKQVLAIMERDEHNPLIDLTSFTCLQDACYGWLSQCRLAKRTLNETHKNMSSLLSAFVDFDYSRHEPDEA